MRLHDRYLFRELLTPLAYCLGGFLVFWISYFFFTELDKLQEHKLHLLDCAEYALAMTPGFFVMVLPIALLLALLYALTHHAKHHELTALRAAGIGLWRLCLPYFVVGVVAGGFYFFLNEVAVPRGADWAEEILGRYVPNANVSKTKMIFNKNGFRIHANRIWQFSQYDADKREMLNPNVTWTQPDGSWRSIQAERALWTNGAWTFFSAQLFGQNGGGGSLLPLFSTNEIAMPEFDERPRQILSDLKLSDSQSLRKSRSADIPLKDLREFLWSHPNLSAADSALYRTKYYGRLAAPWTCLVVVLIAIPFGAQSGRRNLFFGVAGSIFICFSYFVLQQVCLAMGLSNHLAPWLAAGLPNVTFAVIGSALIFRTR
jgi:lipopolysaccharide export system permease protein